MDLKDHLETFFCDILDLKEKKINFYEEWAKKCDDSIGRDVMKAMEDAERRGLEHLKTLHAEFSKTGQWSEVCRYLPERVPVADVVISKAIETYKKSKDNLCSTKIPLEVGLELEEKAIAIFQKYLNMVNTEEEKKFFGAFIAEEKEHLRILNDIKYYYEDPQGWFMEKGRGGLDGA
ncbi:MAG: hypothetical protein N2260_03000 [Syntrophobacterales bacterium]|nr:hypothetical protein [Syntrophobacterales bacterium]